MGAVDRGASRARSELDASQIVRFDGNVPRAAFAVRAPGDDRGRARRGERVRARRLPARAGIARYAGVEPENVVLGAGADDLILLCARTFAGPGDVVAIADGADVSAVPDRLAARRSRGRRRPIRS